MLLAYQSFCKAKGRQIRVAQKPRWDNVGPKTTLVQAETFFSKMLQYMQSI